MSFQYANLMPFDSLTFQQKILIDGFNGLGAVVLPLISKKTQDQDLCWSWCYYCVVFEFWNALLDLSFFSCLVVVPTILLFFRDFFWRSGMLEFWIRSYVHWFGCSLLPGMQLNSSCQDVGFKCPFVVSGPTISKRPRRRREPLPELPPPVFFPFHSRRMDSRVLSIFVPAMVEQPVLIKRYTD